MDKTILKKFAIESRNDLMNRMKNKINSFYIDEEFSKEKKGDMYILSNEKHSLTLLKDEYEKRELLIKRIKDLSLEQVIEESAYTWFNRIIAIRYMELNDILPLSKNNQSLGIRVLSSKENTTDPEILKFTNLINPNLDINFNKEKYSELKEDERFKYVLLLICNKLGKVIPQVFNGITDYIDILIPDNLLNDTGFVNKVIRDVPINNFERVEILGWLYQYYNQTEKDKVMSAKRAYKKNEIPYATQLFTPDWIVKYMVENSLGRYWVEHNGDGVLYPSNNLYSSDNLYPSSSITDNWKYFIKDNIEKQNDKLDPTKITFIDPCCGSGHILVYAFEVFYQIYTKAGYNKNDIPELILKNNLYGLDIDDRAGQLSILSILLKAREYDKNIFNKEIVRNLNIMSIKESKSITQENINYLKSKKDDLEAFSLNETIDYIYDTFKNAKEIGSLLIIDDKDYKKVLDRIEELNKQQLDIFDYGNLQVIESQFISLIKEASILSKKYDIIVTNPPYMNISTYSVDLKDYLSKNYAESKNDLCTAFMELVLAKEDGYYSMINQNSWMFLSSFEKLRIKLINNNNFNNIIHLGPRAFEEIGGEVVQTVTFTMSKININKNTYFVKLNEIKDPVEKEIKYLEIIKSENGMYEKNLKQFLNMPNTVLSYWISDNTLSIMCNADRIGTAVKYTGSLHKTADNNKYLKFVWEVDKNKIGQKWIKYNKGGKSRKWYGNNEYLIDFSEEAKKFYKNNPTSNLLNKEFWYGPGATWTALTSLDFNARYFDGMVISDFKGSSVIQNQIDIYIIISYMNSVVFNYFANIIAPTLDYNIGQIVKIPFLKNYYSEEYKIIELSKDNVKIAKDDYDSNEISIDFKKNALILNVSKINEAVKINNLEIENKINKLRNNEKRLNEIYIKNYNMNEELNPDVDESSIKLLKVNITRDIKSLISYAVGCMFGRYSLDEQGLIYAGGEFDSYKYKTYNADIDNVIPITDEAYFADDIVSRFKEFVKVVYGNNTLNENIDFIAEILGKRNLETSEETIRRYFNNDFYNDHVKMYQKRPIYWQFDSGKKNGFKCLIYMHRYNENLIPKIRLDYLHKVQTTYEKLINDVNSKLKTELSLSDKKETQNRLTELNNKLQETKEYDEKIAYLANQRIIIDLDDGVVANYEKFKDVLAKIK